MNKLAIVEILAKHQPYMVIQEALDLAEEICSLSPASNVVAFPGSDPELTTKAKDWARGVLDADTLLNRKIQSIKTIRAAWPVGLKEAKGIVEDLQSELYRDLAEEDELPSWEDDD